MPKDEFKLLLCTERARLKNRDALDAPTRKYNDFRVRGKVRKWIGVIPDVLFALKHLPENQLSNLGISNTTISDLFDLIEKALLINGRYHIINCNLISTGEVARRRRKGKLTAPVSIGAIKGYQVLQTATSDDLEQVSRVKDFIKNMIDLLGEGDIREIVEYTLDLYDIE